MQEDNAQHSTTNEGQGRAWLAALLLRRQSQMMPRFALALARLRALSRGQRRRLQRRAAASLAGAALLLALSASPLLVPSAQAATIAVANGEIAVNDNGACSLIEAIINANNGNQTHDDCAAGAAGADTIDLPANGSFTFGATYVYAAGDNGLPTISSDITIAGDNSTFDLGGPAVGMRLALVNSSGALTLNQTTIRNGAQDDAVYGGGIFRVDGGSLTVSDSTLTDSTTNSYGGAIFAINSATVTVTGSTLSDSSAFRGGAIYARDSDISLTDSTVSGNTADRSAGGIGVNGGSLSVTRGAVNENGWEPGQIGVTGRVDYGGGILADGSTLSIDGTTINGNYAGYGGGGGVRAQDITDALITGATINDNVTTGYGGGVLWGAFGDGGAYPVTGVIRDSTIDGNAASDGGGVALLVGTLAIERTTISNNTASDSYGFASGGGVANFSSDLTIEQSALTNNTANYGGGLYFDNYSYDGSTVVTNTTISGNDAGRYGGGAFLHTTPVATFNNVTISDNDSQDGGGLAVIDQLTYAVSGNVNLNRTLIAGNRASESGDEVWALQPIIFGNNFNLFGHNGITNGSAFSGFTPGASDITATSDGTQPAALASILLPLADNGGPTTPATKTHALLAGSPAIDRGPNAACTAAPVDGVDQRDVARNQDGNGAASANECDVGAYEFVAAPTAGICPAPDNERTTILGVGMGGTKKAVLKAKITIPNAANLVGLYGQLAGKDLGRLPRRVRFQYPNQTYNQFNVPTGTSAQYGGIYWYGGPLQPASSIKGLWYMNPGTPKKTPRALILYATYATMASYFDTYVVFADGTTNMVAATPPFSQTQTFTIPIDSPTGPADITVQVALVDNDNDGRPITVVAKAGAVQDTDVSLGPTNGNTLSLITLTLPNVPPETSQVTIDLSSSAEGDSAAIVGAAVNYACDTD